MPTDSLLNETKCPECGEDVMATAVACPNCGRTNFVEHPGGITPTKHPPTNLPEADDDAFGPDGSNDR